MDVLEIPKLLEMIGQTAPDQHHSQYWQSSCASRHNTPLLHYLRGRPRDDKVARDAAPVSLPKLGQAHEEEPMLFLRPGDALATLLIVAFQLLLQNTQPLSWLFQLCEQNSAYCCHQQCNTDDLTRSYTSLQCQWMKPAEVQYPQPSV